MSDSLTQAEAIQIMERSMSSPQWGWAYPRAINLLASAHTALDGNAKCAWFARPDINRLECKCGHLFLSLPLMVMSGGWNN